MAVRLALRACRAFNPRKNLVLISVRGWVDPRALLQLEGLGVLKNSITSGIEPATSRLVSQWLHQLCYRVPLIILKNNLKFSLTSKPFRRHPGARCNMLVIPAFANQQRWSEEFRHPWLWPFQIKVQEAWKVFKVRAWSYSTRKMGGSTEAHYTTIKAVQQPPE
jgi:hypothetical protein